LDPILVGIIGIGVLIVLLALGVHIALALAAVGMFGSMAIIGFEPSIWLATAFSFSYFSKSAFIVLPLFIYMGLMAGSGGISHNIYEALKIWVGRLRAGLGIATVGSCTAFGVCTGSSLVAAAVFTRISAPEMRRQGYGKRTAYGVCTSAGSIGMLIPPSILLVVYGIISELSVGKLLIAGTAPGLVLAVSFSVGLWLMSLFRPAEFGSAPVEKVTWRQRIVSLGRVWPVLLLGGVIIGGIFGGLFSPTEAGAFGAAVITILIILTTGSERWKILKEGSLEAIKINAMVFFILVGAGIFARFLMFSGITPMLLGAVVDAGFSNLTFIIIMAFIYLIMGCFLDSISMISITLPIIIPVVREMGIDPIYFAMVSVLAIECGLITPPVGLNAYAAFGVAEPDVTLEDIFIGCLPFFFMMLAALAIMIAFPWLSTILPTLMLGD